MVTYVGFCHVSNVAFFLPGGRHPRVQRESADQVLRASDPRVGDQDAVESVAAQPVRGDKEVHSRPHHQDELGAGVPREGEDLP